MIPYGMDTPWINFLVETVCFPMDDVEAIQKEGSANTGYQSM